MEEIADRLPDGPVLVVVFLRVILADVVNEFLVGELSQIVVKVEGSLENNLRDLLGLMLFEFANN